MRNITYRWSFENPVLFCNKILWTIWSFFFKKKKLYFSPLEIKILKNILEIFSKRKKKNKKKQKNTLDFFLSSYMITLHVNTQPAFMLVVIRLSPILPPPPSLSLFLTPLNFFGPVSTMVSSLSAVTVTNRPIRTYVAPSLSVIVTIDFSFSGSLSI